MVVRVEPRNATAVLLSITLPMLLSGRLKTLRLGIGEQSNLRFFAPVEADVVERLLYRVLLSHELSAFLAYRIQV